MDNEKTISISQEEYKELIEIKTKFELLKESARANSYRSNWESAIYGLDNASND